MPFTRLIVRAMLALAMLCPLPALARPVLLISIDGLRPADVLLARQRGLTLPNLTAFLANGSYAQGVTGVLPTLTYPSHTTLITGVSPARHGIVANTTFDPMNINDGGWYWYAEDDKAQTLWDAAFLARMTTGNVHWPVSVGARHITWNLPQIWRTGHPDDRKLVRALATPGLFVELEGQRREGYADGKDETLPADKLRAGFAQSLIRHHQPGFMTVYLTALDHQQHLTGPGSNEAHKTLEAIDAMVGEIIAIERQFHPDAVIAVVSDHGFASVDTAINRPGHDRCRWQDQRLGSDAMGHRRLVCDRAGAARRCRAAGQSRRVAGTARGRSGRQDRPGHQRTGDRCRRWQSPGSVLRQSENRRGGRSVPEQRIAAGAAVKRLQGHARLFPRCAGNAVNLSDRGPRHCQGPRSG